ncbi:MAG TPA: 2-dehydropantoate 2-reductase N-terminal domain-containing protein [Caldimonas sp.]
MNIVVLGAGTQGTLYGVRLASAGHSVLLIARGQRAAELRSLGATIEHALSGRRQVIRLPVAEELSSDVRAELCLVTVRREQLGRVLPSLRAARGIDRVVFMVNHACGSGLLFSALERGRIVLAFPGVAGSIENGVDRYVEVTEQPTVIEATAPDVGEILRDAGFRVSLVRDMDSWLRRHAVFVTAVSGALYEVGGDAHHLSSDSARVRSIIVAVREGWAAMDGQAVAAAPWALRAIFQWVPLPFATTYWKRLLASPRGEFYFARHTRHAAKEMAALAGDVRGLVPNEAAPQLLRLYAAIDRAAAEVP